MVYVSETREIMDLTTRKRFTKTVKLQRKESLTLHHEGNFPAWCMQFKFYRWTSDKSDKSYCRGRVSIAIANCHQENLQECQVKDVGGMNVKFLIKLENISDDQKRLVAAEKYLVRINLYLSSSLWKMRPERPMPL
jgi:hypothetical protein